MPTSSTPPDDGREVDKLRDPVNGQFQKGYKGGRKHRIDLLSVCAKFAEAEGHSLEELLWGVVKGLMLEASKGNVAAGKILVDRFARDDGHVSPSDPPPPGSLDSPGVVINNFSAGPPAPRGASMAGYLESLRVVEAELGQEPRIKIDPVIVETVEQATRRILGD